MFYSFNQINELVYHFVTDEAVLYKVAFSLDTELDIEEEVRASIFNVILFPVSSDNGIRKDSKIGKTVSNIVYDFETKNPNCCFIYTPDFFDSRQHLRNRLFNIWLASYNMGRYSAVNLEINHIDFDVPIYTTIFYNINYTYIQIVEQAFERKIAEYNALKPNNNN